MDNDYTQIPWPEVRKGDVLLHENGDRLTVESATYANLTGWTFRATVATRGFGTEELERIGFTPYRRKPEMPSEPGAYADKDGKHWMLVTDGEWFQLGGGWETAEDAAEYAPFTRLVPMPTEEAVHSAIAPFVGVRDVSVVQAVGRVMSLLEGESDD